MSEEQLRKPMAMATQNSGSALGVGYAQLGVTKSDKAPGFLEEHHDQLRSRVGWVHELNNRLMRKLSELGVLPNTPVGSSGVESAQRDTVAGTVPMVKIAMADMYRELEKLEATVMEVEKL